MRGRILLTRKYRKALDQAHLASLAFARGAGLRKPMDGAVSVTATFYPPDKRRRDPGNYTKLLWDALQGVCYHDDAQIAQETVRRAPPDSKHPRVEIEVRRA